MQPLVNIPRLNEEEDWQCTSIFRTRVACQGRLCTLIIDGGSCSNLTSKELVEKLNLKIEDHQNPYQIAWVNDTSILMSSHCLVSLILVIILSYQYGVMFCRWKLPILCLEDHGFFMKESNMMDTGTLIHLCAMGVRRSSFQWRKFHHISNQRKNEHPWN